MPLGAMNGFIKKNMYCPHNINVYMRKVYIRDPVNCIISFDDSTNQM